MSRVIIGFTGHRDCTAAPELLHALAQEFPGALWKHGGAIGFDTQVKQFALQYGAQYGGIEQDPILPNYAVYGKAAPIVRNHLIVDASDFLVACWDGRTTGGTFETRKYAQLHEKDIRDWSPDPLCFI